VFGWQLKWRQMWGMMVIVYAKRSLLPFITSVESEELKTGFGGWWVGIQLSRSKF
jgi:hypothetical protein